MPATSRLGQVAGYVVLLVLTAQLVVAAAVTVPLRIGGLPVPLGLLLALGVVPACRTGGALTGSRLGAAGPAVVWLVLALPMATVSTEGDLVVSSSLRGLAFLIIGTLGAAVGVGAWRPPASPGGPDGRDLSRGGLTRH